MGLRFNPLIFSGLDFSGSSSGGTGGTIGGAVTGGTPNALLVVDASGNLGQLGPLTDGQLLIGATGLPAVPANLTGTAQQIDITNGAGSITLSMPTTVVVGSDLAAGIFPLVNGQSFVSLENGNTNTPGVHFYDGLTQDYDILAGVVAGLAIRNTGLVINLLEITDTNANFTDISSNIYATLDFTQATFSGALSASNFSGSSSGTNTGDIDLGTANGLSLLGQVLSLGLSSTSTTGALSSTDWNTFNGKQDALTFVAPLVNTAGSVAINGSVNTNKLNFQDFTDITKKFTFDLSQEGSGFTATLQPRNTQNQTYIIRPNVDTSANIITQNVTSEQIFIGADASIGGSNSGIQYSNATTANRGQIKLGSYVNATSVAGVSTLTSRSGTVGVNAAVVAGQEYSKWTAQAGATTPGSAPISGNFAFVANTVNSLTVTTDYRIQLTNLAGTLGTRLFLGSEGALQLPFYSTGVAQFDASGNITSAAISPSSLSLTNTHILVGNASNVAADVALSGDATLSNTGALTLATVNGNVGSFGSSTSIPSFTVNAKGLITAASGNVVIAPAGTLTGTTLAANVVTSSLTAVGTLTVGTWNASLIAAQYGGTGINGATAANGTLLIGNGAGYTLSTLTAGSGISITNGAGSITIAQSVPSSTGDITQTSFTAADNQAAPADVTGLAFANGSVRSFEALVSIVRSATYAQYKLYGIQKASLWEMTQESVGDDTGLVFSITTAGQVQYTSTSTGSTALLKFRAIVTNV